MHQHPTYHLQNDATTISFLRDRSFGTLVVSGPNGLLAMQAPFLVSSDGASLDLHIFRGNPIAKALSDRMPAVMVVNGPDGYISPDWYGPGEYVSTWNYVSVQIKGTLALLPPEDLHDLLVRQTAAYENRLAPKTPWTMEKVPPQKISQMKRVIHPARFTIEAIEPTWKLGQEKPEVARTGAIESLETGFGSDLGRLSALMRAGGPDTTE